MFPADLQNLIDTAIADGARALKGVADIDAANAALAAARKNVDDATQRELDATAAAAQSEPAAVAAFKQWLHDQSTAAVAPSPTPEPAPVDPAPTADPTPATV